jgi:hypothetical protein
VETDIAVAAREGERIIPPGEIIHRRKDRPRLLMTVSLMIFHFRVKV